MKANDKIVKQKPLSKEDKKIAEAAAQKKITAQDWIPIKDIQNSMMHRRDGSIVMALKVEPINIDLLSKNEVKRIISSLHEIVNGQKERFQILSIGRPVDLDSYLNKMQEMAKNTENYIRKKLLQGYIKQAASMASGGDVLERRFYIIMAHEQDVKAADELYNRIKEMQSNLLTADLKSEICNDTELTSLLFNFTHPAQSAYERVSPGPYLAPQLVWEGV